MLVHLALQCSSVHDCKGDDMKCEFVKKVPACKGEGGFIHYFEFVYCRMPSKLVPLSMVILVRHIHLVSIHSSSTDPSIHSSNPLIHHSFINTLYSSIPSIHFSVHSFIRLFISSLIHPFIHPSTPFIHTSIHTYIHSSIHPNTKHLFIHTFIHSSIHESSFVNLLVHSSTLSYCMFHIVLLANISLHIFGHNSRGIVSVTDKQIDIII